MWWVEPRGRSKIKMSVAKRVKRAKVLAGIFGTAGLGTDVHEK